MVCLAREERDIWGLVSAFVASDMRDGPAYAAYESGVKIVAALCPTRRCVDLLRAVYSTLSVLSGGSDEQ